MQKIYFIELLRGSSIAFLLKITGVILSYIFMYLTSRYFGANGTGIFALSFTILQILSMISKFGIDTSIVKFISEAKINNRESIISIYIISLSFVFLLSSIIATIFFSLSSFIANFIFNKPHLTFPFQLIALAVLPLSLRFVNAEVLKAMKAIVRYSILQYTSVFFFGILLILLYITLYGKKDPTIPTLVLTISMGITFILSFLFVYKEFSKMHIIQTIYISDVNKISLVKEILKTSAPLFLASSFAFLISWTDTIMLGIIKSDSDVGIYNIAVKIVFIMLFPLTAVSSVLMPKVAALWKVKDKESIKYLNKKSMIIIGTVNLFPLILILFLPEKILSIFGNEFTTGHLALSILGIGYFINSILGVLDYTLQMTKYQKTYSKFSLIIFIINLVLNYILIPNYGTVGAALATSISLIIWKILVITFYIRKIAK